MGIRIARLVASVGHARARYLLVGCGVLIVSILTIGSALLGLELRRQDVHRAEQNLQNLSLLLAEEADRGMQSIELVQLGLIDHLRQMGIDTPDKLHDLAGSFAFHQDLERRIAGLAQIGSLGVVDRHGMRLSISRVWPAPPVDDSDRDFFRAPASGATPGLFISEPSLSEGSGEWTIYLSRRFASPDGELIGIIVATIRIRYLEAFFSRVETDEDASFALHRRDGMLLARYPHVDRKLGTTYAGTINFDRVLALVDRGAFSQRSLIDGRSRLIAVHSLAHYPLLFGVTNTMDAVLANSRAAMRAIGGTGIGLEIAIGCIVLFGFRGLRDAERSDAARVLAESELALARERERGERALRRESERFETALGNMQQALLMFDHTDHLLVANPRFCEVAALPIDAITPGMSYADVGKLTVAAGSIHRDDLAVLHRCRNEAIKRQARSTFLWERSDGRAFNVTHVPMAEGWLTTYEDVTERRAAEATIARLARHDALTNLPNRVLLREHLRCALAAAEGGRLVALLCLDLDQFKAVNDTLGHPVGDRLLQAVADRLLAVVHKTDFVARLGGDEFAIVQTDIAVPGDAIGMAEGLIEQIGMPFDIDGHQIVIGASIGIAFAPIDGIDADHLMKCADLALHRAKGDGRNGYRLFEAEMDAAAQARRTLEVELRGALAARQLEVFYQPVVDLQTSRIVGCEALLRWRHPTRGLVPPDQFIPLAEETGLITPIGEWVLRQACADAATWPGGLKVAVNLSAVQFKSQNLVAATLDALHAAGLPGSRLELEITETVMLHDAGTTLATLHQFRERGIRIAMDDFGTGYSSLNYLIRFPFDRVKIDQGFVRQLGKREDCIAIVRAMTALSHALGMATTAEGVETEQQRDVLSQAGCMEAQGYLFSRPIPAAALSGLLRDQAGGAQPAWVQPSHPPSRVAAQNKVLLPSTG